MFFFDLSYALWLVGLISASVGLTSGARGDRQSDQASKHSRMEVHTNLRLTYWVAFWEDRSASATYQMIRPRLPSQHTCITAARTFIRSRIVCYAALGTVLYR